MAVVVAEIANPSGNCRNRRLPRAVFQILTRRPASHPLSSIGSVHCAATGPRRSRTAAFRAQLRATERPATAAEPGEDRTRSAGPSARPAMCHPRAPGPARQSLRCTTRVTRCRTRLICQRHRGSTRPGPRPRPAFSGELQPTGLCVGSSHCLVDASLRGADAPAWSSLRGSRCTLGRNLLRTQEHRRCGRGGCGLPAAMSIAQCSFLPMGNALPSGTPEKHARRQSAADAR
jgi:hypothetical protein